MAAGERGRGSGITPPGAGPAKKRGGKLQQYRAAWLLPISQPPIRHAWLRTDRGRIVAYGDQRSRLNVPNEIDLGRAVVMPGLVNAHTHLELSWMRGRIDGAAEFPDWIRAVISSRRTAEPLADVAGEARKAIAEARRFGTALIGDISNSGITSEWLAESDLAGVVFFELLGFRAADAPARMEPATDHVFRQPGRPHVRHSLAAHAPYSVSPALFRAIRQALREKPLLRPSIHLGESQAEIAFLQSGKGPWRDLLEDFGVWDSTWSVPRCNPVEYIDRIGFLDERLIVVHGVQFGEVELKRIALKGATLVSCPRGNIRTGAGAPPTEAFFESGARIALGTDSLASVPDMNVFSELAEMRRLTPRVPARALLECATLNGARALGFESEFGTLEPGKRDAILVVEADVVGDDVEESLLAGVDASQVRWLRDI